MTERASQLLQQALSLSEEERAELASSLLESLDSSVLDEGVQEAWNEEIARRIEEIDSGKVKPVAWPDVRRRLYSKFRND